MGRSSSIGLKSWEREDATCIVCNKIRSLVEEKTKEPFREGYAHTECKESHQKREERKSSPDI